MNKKSSLLLTAGVFALLSACGDSVIEGDTSPNKATLNVLARDASSGKPLRASVKLLTTGAADSTSAATGVLSFADVSMGTHQVLVEKEGYAPMTAEALIPEGSSVNAVANENTVQVFLLPLTSSLDGYVYYEDKSGKRLPAKQATVRLQLEYAGAIDRILEEKTNDDGKFTFSKMPAISSDNYRIWIMGGKFGEQDYETQTMSCYSNCPSILSGSAAHFSVPLVYNYGSGSGLAFMGAKNVIKSTDELVIEFSDAIDAEKFSINDIQVSFRSNPWSYDPYTMVDKILAGNKITLKPLGKWNTGGFRVTISGNLTSVKGASLGNSLNHEFSVIDGALGTITALSQVGTVTECGSNVQLKWNKVANASDYKIYAKASAGTNKESFVEIESHNLTLIATDATTETWMVSLSNNASKFGVSNIYDEYCGDEYGSYYIYPFFKGDNSVTFIVQAYNSTAQTALTGEGVKTLTVKKAP
jgi:hypothetical protein